MSWQRLASYTPTATNLARMFKGAGHPAREPERAQMEGPAAGGVIEEEENNSRGSSQKSDEEREEEGEEMAEEPGELEDEVEEEGHAPVEGQDLFPVVNALELEVETLRVGVIAALDDLRGMAIELDTQEADRQKSHFREMDTLKQQKEDNRQKKKDLENQMRRAMNNFNKMIVEIPASPQEWL